MHFIVRLCLVIIPIGTASAEAAVVARSPNVVLSSSADYPEMVFVLYLIKEDNPWATGIRVDPTTAKMVAANTEFEWSLGQAAILAVPRTVAEKKKTPDPAWLESSTPGVIRIPESFFPPHVYRRAVLRYQLQKTDKGPKLTLLNPDELKAAQQEYVGVMTTQPSFLVQPLFLWGLAAGAALGLIVRVGFSWRLKRHNQSDRA
jgi:hypothetical protein